MPPSKPNERPLTLRERVAVLHEFCVHTWVGRLLALGLGIKVLYWGLVALGVPAEGWLHAISSLGGLALAVAIGTVLYRLVQAARRDLLWRVRRQLIISYIFIGAVPVILVAAFFLLAGRLLFNNVSSYLIQSSVREMTTDAQALARTAAVELAYTSPSSGAHDDIAQQFGAWAGRYPGISVAYIPLGSNRCGAGQGGGQLGAKGLPPLGTWGHGAVPASIPEWVTCAGFAGVVAVQTPSAPDVRSVAVVRATALRNGGAVVVDVPFDQTVRARIEAATGVAVGAFSLLGEGASPPLPAAPLETAGWLSTLTRFQWVAMVDQVDWATGAAGALHVQIGFSVAEIYTRLSASQALLGDFLGTLLLFIAGLFLIIQIGALAMGFALARSITGSIHELFAGTERIRHGDFTHRISVRVRDQLGALADSFNQMTGSIEDLLRQAAEKKRLEEEMRLAREIQMSLLPPGPLVVPGMGVSALCVPAREVGGDYYDVLALDGGRVGVLIADVAGKGMSAALYMAELKGLMLSLTRIHSSPRELLLAANRLISEHLDSRSFITMTYAVIDPPARTMVYARAGHTPLIHVPCTTGAASRAVVLAPDGMVVGLHIDDGARFEGILQEATLALAPGDLLAFFTDGISEAMNEESDCFGEPRLAHLLEAHAHLPVDELRERVLREIDAFVGEAAQHDDMTMILLRVGEEPCQTRS
jgi:serine phosphatase RsbU (regulator of sigma subunit)